MLSVHSSCVHVNEVNYFGGLFIGFMQVTQSDRQIEMEIERYCDCAD